MKHVLVVYGKKKSGRGKARIHIPQYKGYVPINAAQNARKWLVEIFKGLGPTPEELK
jgi:hypothetical protein